MFYCVTISHKNPNIEVIVEKVTILISVLDR